MYICYIYGDTGCVGTNEWASLYDREPAEFRGLTPHGHDRDHQIRLETCGNVVDILSRPTKEEKSDGCGGASRRWGHCDGATRVQGQATLVGPDSTIIKSVRRRVIVGTKGELQAHTQTSTHANEHTSTKLQKIFNYVHCSATPQREAAPATKATRGQSQVPDRGTDSRSAGFPPPSPHKMDSAPPPPIKWTVVQHNSGWAG